MFDVFCVLQTFKFAYIAIVIKLKRLIHRRVSVLQELFLKNNCAIKCYEAVVLHICELIFVIKEKKITIKSSFSDMKNCVLFTY